MINKTEAVQKKFVDDYVLDRIENEDVSAIIVVERAEILNSNLSKEELTKILKMPDPLEIYYNYPLSIKDKESFEIIKSTNNKTIGSETYYLTGGNQSICIIDTGVNYKHSDLGGCFGYNNISSNCKVIAGYDIINNDSDPVDDNGHGTSIAGVIAANGELKGIIPEAKIIALKALDSNGRGDYATVLKSISWCLDNSELFNIKVISLSFSTDCSLYPQTCSQQYCDSTSPFTPLVNIAFSKNISVIAATGNEGNLQVIPTPACVSKVIRVGSTDKLDNLETYTNRNSLLKLLAPGTNIYSTSIEGYNTFSGTSMAVPHLAGAVLILEGLAKRLKINLTPDKIEEIFLLSGKKINDNFTNLSFHRIDIANALDNLYNYYFLVKLSPNKVYMSTPYQTFYCNATSNDELSEVTFLLWNSTSVIYNKTISVSGLYNESIFNYTFNSPDTYVWNCIFINNIMAKASASENASTIFDIVSPLISPITPKENYSLSTNLFNINLSEEGDCNYSLDENLTSIVMDTNDRKSFNFIETNLAQDTIHNVTFYCNDLAGNNASLSIFDFEIDLISPIINLTMPDDKYSETASFSWINFSFNVIDNKNISNCDLILKNQGGSNMNNITLLITIDQKNISQSIKAYLEAGEYEWMIKCIDEAGNYNISAVRKLIINALPLPTYSSNGQSGRSSGGGSIESENITKKNIDTQVTFPENNLSFLKLNKSLTNESSWNNVNYPVNINFNNTTDLDMRIKANERIGKILLILNKIIFTIKKIIFNNFLILKIFL